MERGSNSSETINQGGLPVEGDRGGSSEGTARRTRGIVQRVVEWWQVFSIVGVERCRHQPCRQCAGAAQPEEGG